jgi:hypothetical protein
VTGARLTPSYSGNLILFPDADGLEFACTVPIRVKCPNSSFVLSVEVFPRQAPPDYLIAPLEVECAPGAQYFDTVLHVPPGTVGDFVINIDVGATRHERRLTVKCLPDERRGAARSSALAPAER